MIVAINQFGRQMWCQTYKYCYQVTSREKVKVAEVDIILE